MNEHRDAHGGLSALALPAARATGLLLLVYEMAAALVPDATTIGLLTVWPRLVLLAALALSLLASAWTRSIRPLPLGPSGPGLDDGSISSLKSRPSIALAVSPDLDRPVAHAAEALAAMGLRVRRGPLIAEGVSSPFRTSARRAAGWLLSIAVIVLFAGQVTRFEGELALLPSAVVPDHDDNYLSVQAGPLASSRTGTRSLVLAELVHEYEGSRGTDPRARVLLLGAGEQVQSEWLQRGEYLTQGRTSVRNEAPGDTAVFSLEATTAEQLSRVPVLLERRTGDRLSTSSEVISLADPSGQPVLDVRVRISSNEPSGRLPVGVPEAPRAIVETATAGNDRYGEPIELELGSALALEGGQQLRFVSTEEWLRVSVIDDWSPPWVLGILVLTGLAQAVAAFGPQRVVQMLLVEDGQDRSMHVLFAGGASRRFEATVIGVLRDALEPPDDA